MSSHTGVTLWVCQQRVEGAGRTDESPVTIVEIGPEAFYLLATTATPEQLFLLLRIAATFSWNEGIEARDEE